MDAVGVTSQRDIGTIVDDERHAMTLCHSEDAFGFDDEDGGAGGFVAQLQDVRPAVDGGFSHERQIAPARGGSIEDDVKMPVVQGDLALRRRHETASD